MTDNNPDIDPVDTPDGDVPLSLAEYREIIEEIERGDDPRFDRTVKRGHLLRGIYEGGAFRHVIMEED